MSRCTSRVISLHVVVVVVLFTQGSGVEDGSCSAVVETIDGIGILMCERKCALHGDCCTFNYDQEHLRCRLLGKTKRSSYSKDMQEQPKLLVAHPSGLHLYNINNGSDKKFIAVQNPNEFDRPLLYEPTKHHLYVTVGKINVWRLQVDWKNLEIGNKTDILEGYGEDSPVMFAAVDVEKDILFFQRGEVLFRFNTTEDREEVLANETCSNIQIDTTRRRIYYGTWINNNCVVHWMSYNGTNVTYTNVINVGNISLWNGHALYWENPSHILLNKTRIEENGTCDVKLIGFITHTGSFIRINSWLFVIKRENITRINVYTNEETVFADYTNEGHSLMATIGAL